jgi:hypothetical protein
MAVAILEAEGLGSEFSILKQQGGLGMLVSMLPALPLSIPVVTQGVITGAASLLRNYWGDISCNANARSQLLPWSSMLARNKNSPKESLLESAVIKIIKLGVMTEIWVGMDAPDRHPGQASLRRSYWAGP